VFITLVHELAEQVPLGKLYRIDGTDISVDHQDDDAQWNYDHAEDDFYYGYGCCLVTAADNIPVAATFTPAKKVDQETAMRVTGDALAVEKPIWMLGDAEFDMLDWHDRLLEQGVVPVVPYNQRNADEPLDIGYRVEDTIAVSKERLGEAYRKRSRIETAIGVCKDLGLGTPRVRGRVRVQSHVFLVLCLRLAVAFTNHERDNNIASPTITLCEPFCATALAVIRRYGQRVLEALRRKTFMPLDSRLLITDSLPDEHVYQLIPIHLCRLRRQIQRTKCYE
jgi:hypothetical protein